MKLLMLSANLPLPVGGANARNYHLLKALARKHTVSLLAFASTAELETATDMSYLECLTHELQVIPQGMNMMKRFQQFADVARGQGRTPHQD